MGQCSSFVKRLFGGKGTPTTEQGRNKPWNFGRKAATRESGAMSPQQGMQGIMGGPSMRLPRLPRNLDGLVTLIGGMEAFKSGSTKMHPPDLRNAEVYKFLPIALSKYRKTSSLSSSQNHSKVECMRA